MATLIVDAAGTEAYTTITGAVNAASTDDTIRVYDGIYNEVDHATNGIVLDVDGLTIEPHDTNSDYGVIVTSTGTTQTVQIAADGVTIGKIKISANGVSASGIRYLGASQSGLVLNGTWVHSSDAYAVYLRGSAVLKGGFKITGYATTGALHFGANGIGDVIIRDGTIDVTVDSGNAITAAPNVGGARMIIDNMHITVNDSNTSGKCFNGDGLQELYITNSTFIRRGDNAAPIGIIYEEDGTLPCTKVFIDNNTLTTTTGATISGGYGIVIGGESAASGAGMTNVLVSNNTIKGFDHGLMMGGGVTDALCHTNKVSDGILGIICKHTDANTIIRGCTVSEMRGGGRALGFKAAVGSRIENCTVVVAEDYGSAVALIDIDSDGGTHCALVEVTNCNFHIKSKPYSYKVVVEVAVSNTAVFSSNNYYNDHGFKDEDFDSATTLYSYNEWVTNVETNAMSVDSGIVAVSDAPTHGDIIAGGVGTKGNKGKDATGRRFNNPPTIGAIEAAR